MGKYQIWGSFYNRVPLIGFILGAVGIAGLLGGSYYHQDKTILIIFAVVGAVGGILVRSDWRPVIFKNFDPVKMDENRSLTIPANHPNKYGPLIILYVIGALAIGGVCFILGLVLYSPFAPSAQSLFEEAAVGPAALISFLISLFLAQIWIKRALAESKLYGPTKGRELILTPTHIQFSIGVIYDRDVIKMLIKLQKSYLEIPWAEIKSFSVWHDNIPSRSQYRPPLYSILYGNNSVQVTRTFFSGKEEQIFDYVRSRNVGILSDDNPLS